MIVVSAEEMRAMDRLTIEKYGIASLTLMENAGARVAQTMLERFASEAKRGVLVVAGKGNNGGDGLVVARVLKKKRVPCEVVLLAKRHELSRDAAENLGLFLDLNGKVTEVTGDQIDLLSHYVRGQGLLVDAILGTGIHHEVRGHFAEAITIMTRSGVPIVAIDIPSGLQTDTGKPLGACVRANMTVALGYAKIGEVIYPGIEFVGDLVVADIGIDGRAVDEVSPKTAVLQRDQVRSLVPLRKPDTHKGTYGHVLVIAGSRGKTGAAILASRAAMRTGAGLVTLAAARSLNNVLAGALVEVMTELLGENAAEEVEPLGEHEWRRLLDNKNALLFGPGIGVGDSTRDMLRWLLRHLDLPWVIDADGLNNLVFELDRLQSAKRAPVLTPHPGEMARLLGETSATVNQDRIGAARAFASRYRCYLVLKGARTVIAIPEGKVFINPTGNPAMASGGMGDVLAGILAALLGQGFSPEDAMKLGVYLHGFVGDCIAREKGSIGLIASDIIEGLPSGIKEISRPTP